MGQSRFYLLFAVVSVLAAFLWVPASAQREAPARVVKWEYKVVTVRPDADIANLSAKMERELNKLGEGWECVGAVSESIEAARQTWGHLICKRPKQ